MRDIIKSVIENGAFELADMVNKIDYAWCKGQINTNDREELLKMAREKALPEKSYASVEQRFEDVYKKLDEVNKKLSDIWDLIRPTTLEEPPVVDTEVVEYPEYKQPLGSHDAYKNGDKVTFNGQKYICTFDGCVWDPALYPGMWQLVEESTTETAAEIPVEPMENGSEVV